MGEVLARLREDEEAAAWLDGLRALGGPVPEPVLPSVLELPGVLLDLAVPHEDVNEVVELRDRMLADEDWRWLLGRCAAGLFGGLDPTPASEGGSGGGHGTGGPPMPRLPAALGAAGRLFAVFVFLAALPRARALHRERGIPAEVSRRTFADLGRQLAVHRMRNGTSGVNKPSWLRLHLRAELFQLGRLQFQRSDPAPAWVPLPADRAALTLHIPDFSGPLSEAACEESLALARDFFPRHFPERRWALAHCSSWLLDPQLGDYLAADSNILAFQRRFHLVGVSEAAEAAGAAAATAAAGVPGTAAAADDEAPLRYVFGPVDLPPAELPRRTSLERAIGDHLRAGGHWHGGRGWFAL
ncbi:acyltransferase domain-containing protein [Kitasatospora sp. NBC_01287]|uniref:acyltransferase domain-containing protein n=1 Tax=Kitasatospora sp. NBC_01287 TaxID=2903573 RepID=UPI0022579C4E|nr:acyltransferase domain-containing protein [Kitasatospora sp. NBC_01287]MCX4750353.1 acyltransferase domain-containing protein [Kitasatospora sp. NBC_01287]